MKLGQNPFQDPRFGLQQAKFGQQQQRGGASGASGLTRAQELGAGQQAQIQPQFQTQLGGLQKPQGIEQTGGAGTPRAGLTQAALQRFGANGPNQIDAFKQQIAGQDLNKPALPYHSAGKLNISA